MGSWNDAGLRRRTPWTSERRKPLPSIISKEGVDKIIKDGLNNTPLRAPMVNATTCSSTNSRCWPRLRSEAVKKRVPLFVGCTSPNPREVVQKMNFVKDLGADGVLLGVPYYETLHVQDAIKFYHDIADLFPTLNIVIYHNPENHKFNHSRSGV